jgi:hypothetical protein
MLRLLRRQLPLEAWPREHLAVHQSIGNFAPRHREDVLAGFQPIVTGQFLGPGEPVRGEDDVVQFEQGIGRIHRLFLEHIDAGAGDPLLA